MIISQPGLKHSQQCEAASRHAGVDARSSRRLVGSTVILSPRRKRWNERQGLKVEGGEGW